MNASLLTVDAPSWLDRSAGPLRIAVLAPPWITVPPPGYGGTEAVVELLCAALVRGGHKVTLFAAPGSRSPARVQAFLEAAHPDEIGASIYESDHVACAWEKVEMAAKRGVPFDVLHDHSGFTALAMADRIDVPMVHTIHGPFTADTARFYRRHGGKASLVAISRSQAASAPAGVRISAIVPNPIKVSDWPFRAHKQDYVLWVGRIDPVKGPDCAIEAAKLSGRRLVLAGPVQPGQENYFAEQIEPYLDGYQVRHVGEVAGTGKKELFARATALLMPVRWPEPFGLVMVEALACGTPVIAFPKGAAAEIVIDGENGLLVADEAEMARAITGVGAIDPHRCRASVAARYDTAAVALAYEQLYRRAIDGDHAHRAAQFRAAPNGSRTRTVGEHWQHPKTSNAKELLVSTAGANGAFCVELVRVPRRGGRR
jgi:glycosyltransferase involved in cell wall biosynthesis